MVNLGKLMGEKFMTVVATLAIMIMAPFILTTIINGRVHNSSVLEGTETGKDVIIQINGQNKLIDVEIYIAGVLPGLVDYNQSMEVIEAQAVAIRTKIYFAMGTETLINESALEYDYYSEEELISRLGKNQSREAIFIYETAVKNTCMEIIK